MISKFVVILIGCIFGSIAGIIPSNLIMFYGFTTETFIMSIPFIVVGLVGVVACFYFAQKMDNTDSELKLKKIDTAKSPASANKHHFVMFIVLSIIFE